MNDRRNLLKESLVAIERLQAKLEASERSLHEPIAIVGAGCRYPGNVECPEALWQLVRDGVDAVGEIPGDRWDADAYYDADPAAPGRMITRRGGFLSQVDRFDAQYFGISPREAALMDPQQRLLLETAGEALESAGIASERLAGSSTGVFVGITTSDYGQLLRQGGAENSDVYSATGSALNAAAGRISFTFGFQGPCVAVDTACSSSLVAVHLACQSLRTRESDLALAGGVNVILSPDAMILFSKWGMMAPDGACKTFDAAADGFVRSEGCAMLALKRLGDAVAAGDPILAVIRGTAVNSDGRSSGLTVPNGPAQQAVLRRALRSAGLRPTDIAYVEAHGTGTSLGDPIEMEAVGAVFGEGRSPEQPLRVGSIKTNIGHAEAASGLAGLLKVVMALRHEAIPPHLHFAQPSTAIPWAELPVEIPTRLIPWPRTEVPRRAGVSSFGFSGTNAHVVIEEAPATAPSSPEGTAAPVLVPLSARSDTALRELASQHAAHLDANPEAALHDVACTLAIGRNHLPHRLALVAESARELREDLRAFAAGEPVRGASTGTVRAGARPKLGFLFTGQGAQYPGMGRGLYETEPLFRRCLDRAAEVLAPRLERPLLDVMFAVEPGDNTLSQTAYTQPALFALEYALAELWRARGIEPAMVMGHSVGEYAAACVAGVFTFEEGLELVAERGRLMQALPPGGEMAAVFAGEAQVADRIRPYGDRLSIAAVNGPEETVVAGDAEAVAAVSASAAAEGLGVRPLEVSHAFHSARLDPMLDALERRAASVAGRAPRIALVSNLTGRVFEPGTGPDARYWRRHARDPVRFRDGIETLRKAGITGLVEVGPHPTLLALAARCSAQADWHTAASLQRGRDDRRAMLSALGTLHVSGANVQWQSLPDAGRARRTPMPTYPFQRERHWWVPPVRTGDRGGAAPGHPLIGRRLQLAAVRGGHVWSSIVSQALHPWLGDHRVQGVAIVPATAYIEMALAAGAEIFGDVPLAVARIENLKPIILHDETERELQVTLIEDGEGASDFTVCSRARPRTDATGPEPHWTVHATARVARCPGPTPEAVQLRERIETLRDGSRRQLTGDAFYAALARKGNQWGPAFQGVAQVWLGDGEAAGRVATAPGSADGRPGYRFHPAVSDACGHPLAAAILAETEGDAPGGAFVGGGIGEVRFYGPPTGASLWVHAQLRAGAEPRGGVVVGDVHVFDDEGNLVSETRDARLWYLDEQSGPALLGVPDDWYYVPRWVPQKPDAAGRATDTSTWLVLADRRGVGASIAARRRAAGLPTVLASLATGDDVNGSDLLLDPGDPAAYRRMLTSIAPPSVIVHLWGLDDGTVSAPPAGDGLAGPESCLHVLQTMMESKAAAQPRLWLVTAGAQHVEPADRCESPWGALLWGLGRTMSAEHGESWGGLVDLDPAADSDSAADMLIAEIESRGREDKIAIRQGRRYVARLANLEQSSGVESPFAARQDATYLVTGGLGGIGLAMARWLVERGARHLLLIGRSGLPAADGRSAVEPGSAAARALEGVAALRSLGARVDVSALDIAAVGALEGCLEARRRDGLPEVRGVIHAAGTLQFTPLAAQQTDQFRTAIAAKVRGSWLLHRAFEGGGLDWMVLCSSSSALLSSPLLGAYAAANAFMDSLAWLRRSLNLPTLSVNWGTWGEVGMAVHSGRSATGTMLTGMGTIPTAHGIAALEHLLQSGTAQAALMPIDWPALVRAYPQFAADPFLGNLAVDAGGGDVPAAPALRLDDLAGCDPARKVELIGDYLHREAARVLGMSADRLARTDPLSATGFDSLMAVQLKNRIERDLGLVVPMIRFLQGPSVDQLTEVVLEQIASSSPAAGAESPAESVAWEEGAL